jgi:hypothetical protein
MAPKKRRKFNTCPNCAYQFHGVDNFCPNCGQENHNLNVPFKHLFLELLEGTLHFDTKFWHTIKLLLFKPGRLTEQFVLNKRASYVPPIRLYVFISFIFFLIIATDSLHKSEETGVQDSVTTSTAIEEDPNQDFDSNQTRENFTRIAAITDPAKLDSILRADNIPQNNFTRTALQKVARFISYSPEERTHRFYKNVSLMMFLFMPFFAFILKGAYFRQKRNYIQHLIFSIHFHCFLFLIFTISVLIDALVGTNITEPFAILLSILYFFLALYFFYKQSLVRTVFKGTGILFMYLFTLLLFFGAAGIISILL